MRAMSEEDLPPAMQPSTIPFRRPGSDRHATGRLFGLLMLFGFVALLSSGCCSAALHTSVTIREQVGGVRAAYRPSDTCFAELEIGQSRGLREWGSVPGYALLRPDGVVRKHRKPLPPAVTSAIISLRKIESESFNPSDARKDTLYWREVDAQSPGESWFEVWFFSRDQWVTTKIPREDTYIPARLYPKLILLTPLALIGDVLTLPLWFAFHDFDKAFSG